MLLMFINVTTVMLRVGGVFVSRPAHWVFVAVSKGSDVDMFLMALVVEHSVQVFVIARSVTTKPGGLAMWCPISICKVPGSIPSQTRDLQN